MTIPTGLQNIHCDTSDLKHLQKEVVILSFLKNLIFNLEFVFKFEFNSKSENKIIFYSSDFIKMSIDNMQAPIKNYTSIVYT